MLGGSIRIRILVPVTAAVVVLLGGFVFSVQRNAGAYLEADLSRALESVPRVLDAELKDRADIMSAALMGMARDQQLKAAFRAQDIPRLLALAGPLFDQLHAEHGISNLYFSDSERVNLLRVHSPERSGDTIDRHTTDIAWMTGKQSQGLELGTLGTLTLRVVVPWYDEQGMIGLVELGEEIDHIIPRVRDACGVELCVIIDKAYLSEESWRAHKEVYGPHADWDEFPDSVVIAQTLDSIPESVSDHFTKWGRGHGMTRFRAETERGWTKGVLNYRILDGSFVPLIDARGVAVGRVVVLHDITTALASTRAAVRFNMMVSLIIAVSLWASFYIFLGRLQESLRVSEEKFRSIFDNATDGIFLADVESKRFHTANPAGCKMLGYSPEEIMGMGIAEIHPEESLPYVVDKFAEQARGEITLAADIPVKRRDGSVFYADVNARPVSLGGRTYLMGMFRDITERRRAERIIRRQAHYDALTDLPNRIMFEDRLGATLAAARAREDMVAVLFLDLDRLKLVNDSFGHAHGDQVLKQSAQRIKLVLRPGDVVARLGGDEFAASLGGIGSPKDAAAVAWRVLAALRSPFEIDGDEVHVTVSIGISLYPTDGTTSSALLRNADAAMYEAKKQGRNRLYFHTAGMTEEAHQRITLENDLRQATGRGELELRYQPQIEIETGRVIAVEALLRWRHPERGMLVPADFLGVAQESGLIDGIGEWVLRTACAQAKVWESQRVHDPTPRVAVNLSGREFRREGLADMVASCLAEAGLEAGLLELEISESAMTWNVERSIGIMRELKELGTQIALDDFGLGHSSLIDLKRFPADALKIDQSFIRDLMKDDGQQAIVEAIIAMARSLGVRTVAEGVETDEQLALLRRRECHAVQGYLYSRPLSAEDLIEFLVRRDASVEQPHVLP